MPRVRSRQRCFHVRPRGSRRHRSLIRSIIRSCTVLGGGEVPGRLNGAASKSSISPKGDRQFGSLFLLRRVSLQTTTPSRERPMVRIPLPNRGAVALIGAYRYVPRMATLGDVARRAGVSAASVSRVLNHPAKVSPAVRERIMRAMGGLGYVRDGAARALASRHSLTIGNVGIGIFAAGVAALQRRLEEFGYQLLVAASDYDEVKEARHVRALIERGVDGIALVGQRHAPEVYQLLRSRKLPYVNTYQFDGQNPHPC